MALSWYWMILNIPRGFAERNGGAGELEGFCSTGWFRVYFIVKYSTIMLDSHVYRYIWKFRAFCDTVVILLGEGRVNWLELRMPTVSELPDLQRAEGET